KGKNCMYVQMHTCINANVHNTCACGSCFVHIICNNVKRSMYRQDAYICELLPDQPKIVRTSSQKIQSKLNFQSALTPSRKFLRSLIALYSRQILGFHYIRLL